jgi:hypothetical protein
MFTVSEKCEIQLNCILKDDVWTQNQIRRRQVEAESKFTVGQLGFISIFDLPSEICISVCSSIPVGTYSLHDCDGPKKEMIYQQWASYANRSKKTLTFSVVLAEIYISALTLRAKGKKVC